MPDYRRNFLPGGTYFFTVVTHERRPILATENGRSCLRQAIAHVKEKQPFEIVALVLLPDHAHAVWTLPRGDAAYPVRWAQIKEKFTRLFLDAGGDEGSPTASRTSRRERAIWQRRFWEHTCRDEDDLKRCVDYLHWNPVRHALVRSVGEYPWSSFHRFVRSGEYDPNWGRDVSFPGSIDAAWE
jgi:REP-associated tyrosine transposase